MRSVQQLYRIAEKQNITVDQFTLHSREALSVMDPEGNCFIAIDPAQIRDEADHRSKIAHELGHCITGAFYNRYSNYDCRQRHENRADKWAIKKLIPVDALDNAIASGHTELWQLADHFGVTEPLMRRAVCYYVHGNLAADLYF